MVDLIKTGQGNEPRNNPGSVSQTDFTQTQAFRDAVAKATAEAVAKATAEITSKISAAHTSAGTNPTSDTDDFARKLALAITQASDPQNKHKHISPEETLRREASQSKMLGLIAKCRAEDVVPRYTLKTGTYLDERWVEATWTDRNHVQRRTEIGWPGIPNESMDPASEEAREIFLAYRIWIGGPTERVSHPTGKGGSLRVMHEGEVGHVPHVGRPRNPDLAILGRDSPGEIKETAILGTIAKPARTLA